MSSNKALALAIFFLWVGICFLPPNIWKNVLIGGIAGWQVGGWCSLFWNKE